MKLFTSFTLAAVLAAPLAILHAGSLTPPDGEPAPTMKTLDQIEPGTPIGPDDVPYTITEPGRYYLTGNIDLEASGILVTIESNGVTLDLMGFYCSNGAGAIEVNCPAPTEVTIKNGVIMDDVGILDDDDNSSDSVKFEDVRFIRDEFKGEPLIHTQANLILRRCEFLNLTTAIECEGEITITATDTTISNCQKAFDSSNYHYPITASGLTISNCFELIGRAHPIHLRDCTLVSEEDIELSSNSSLTRCDLTFRNTSYGIFTQEGNNIRLSECTLVNSTPLQSAIGIKLDTNAQIIRTEIHGFDVGINVNGDAVIERVTIIADDEYGGASGIKADTGLIATNCTIIGYEHDGILCEGSATITNCRIQATNDGQGPAINANDSSTLTDCIISGYDNGIEAGGDTTLITGCKITGPNYRGHDGINGQALSVSTCSIINFRTGICADESQITDNRIMNCETGIVLENGFSLATGNVIHGQAGIESHGPALIADNKIVALDHPALNVNGGEAGNVVVRNIAAGNDAENLFPGMRDNNGYATIGPVIYGNLGSSETPLTSPIIVIIDGEEVYTEPTPPNDPDKKPLDNINPWANVASSH